MSAREKILEALGRSGSSELPAVQSWNRSVEGDLWQVFVDRFHEAAGEFVEERQLPEQAKWCIEPETTAFAQLLGLDCSDDVWQADIGLSRACVAIAETGSLLLRHGEASRRLASLAPPTHVVLVDPADVVPTLEAGLERLDGRNAALVTGPARTADIEGVIVMGAHGPGKLLAVRCPR